ncbi:MAG: chromate transporter [Alicyclobacillus sp.]|nr:chromate transporter [Alicyclobacillus sp.]
MVRTGVFTYGGGPSVIPLLRHEAVHRFHWVSDEEFGEIVAVANALPGPIATKLAAYLGYGQKGWLGAVLAVLAHIFPSGAAMLLLFGVMHAVQHSPRVQGMIDAVDPVIAVMMGVMAYEFAEKAWKGLGRWFSLAVGVVAALLILWLNVSPALVIVAYLAYGAFHLRLVRRIQRRRGRGEGASV